MIRWNQMPILLAAVALAALALTAHAAAEPRAVGGTTLTSGRTASLVAGVAALAGAFIGGRALARAGDRRRGAIAALVLGPIGLILGGLVVATANGGLGTGNGLGGGVVAMAVGLIGVTLGGLALARSRRGGRPA